MSSPVLKLTKPTLGGRVPVKVGRTTYGMPVGVAVAHSWLHGASVTYVLESRGGFLHCFTEAGEVGPLPEALQRMVRERLFGEKPD